MNFLEILSKLKSLPAWETLRQELAERGDIYPVGLPKSGQVPVAAGLAAEHDGPIVFLTGRIENVPILTQELATWLGDSAEVMRFPEPSPLPFDRAPWGDNCRQGRLTVLTRMLGGQTPILPKPEKQQVVVASARALLQQTLPKRNFIKTIKVLRLGQIVDLNKLEADWVSVGYEKSTVVERPGQYSRRGGILDIFPAGGSEFPLRVEFFGDEIDTLRWFDPASQRATGGNPDRAVIPPAREAIPADGKELGMVLQFDAPPKPDDLPSWQDDIDDLVVGLPNQHLEFYLPLIYQRPDSLLHFLPDNALVFVDDWVTYQQTINELHQQADQLEGEQESLPTSYRSPLFLWQELVPLLTENRVIVLGDHIPADERENNLPQTDLAASFHAGPRYGGQMKPLMFQLQHAFRTHEPTVILSRQSDRLESMWRSGDINQGRRISQDDAEDELGAAAPISNFELPPSGDLSTPAPSILTGDPSDLPEPEAESADPSMAQISFVNTTLSEGFTLEDHETDTIVLNLLTDAEIFGWNRPAPRRFNRKRSYAPESMFSDLVAGDYIVHSEYGVGRFLGMVVRSIGGADREYLKTEYSNNDILYVPVHHADRMSKWIGSEDFAPKLNRLGDKRWGASKKKAQRDIDQLADELLELYAAREGISGHAFAADTDWQYEMEAAFPYQETEDQLDAISAIKDDMENARPMDRLICGDVGYGKTEVALRAAFKAAADDRQVAILVPTTVLAQQHFNTFSERMSPFPFKVRMLSRFRTQAQQDETIKGLKNGDVDIVIGTHRLISNDVSFKNLGLVIIDEEQRFGVGHKEKLKQLRTEVDVLTMTATPIPRTMHMALTGLRDISLIATAPAERLPVQTYVGEMDDQLVRRAILREIDRGGQVFFVHNRVQTIETVRRGLEKLVPEAIIGIGHGQMGERELEAVMADFADGKIDILLSTTIIESGLDIPNANTMIVNRANMFGLAQLYQLRGRVGRGTHRAYGYFFHDAWGKLTKEAQARLETISEATELGAGYTIAMRDLEIRGAGDVLGGSQSGHIATIGYDLYTRMLARAIQVRKAAKEGKVIEMDLPDTTLIDLPLPTYIPPDYIPDPALRLRLYRRMAVLIDLEAVDGMVAELTDRFGPIPDPVENLLYQLRIKILALRAGVSSISTEHKQIRLQLPRLMAMNRERMQSFLGQHVRVSRTGIWSDATLPTREWQMILVATLEKLEEFRKG
ncbi:MAG: transcription-repair coupling factor [Anaerolineae bacterium]